MFPCNDTVKSQPLLHEKSAPPAAAHLTAQPAQMPQPPKGMVTSGGKGKQVERKWVIHQAIHETQILLVSTSDHLIYVSELVKKSKGPEALFWWCLLSNYLSYGRQKKTCGRCIL